MLGSQRALDRKIYCLGFTLGVLQILASSAGARPLSEQEVRIAVETWVRQVTADARPTATVEKMQAHEVGGQVVGYVAHLSDGGYCLCGADDLVLPVYLYCPAGRYVSGRADFQAVFVEIEERTRRLREGSAAATQAQQALDDALTARRALWAALVAGSAVSTPSANGLTSGPGMMELQLTCAWDQGSPFNDQCPALPTGERTVVGCTATATAQIMYYWKWPLSGVGSKTVHYDYRWRSNWDEEPLAANPAPGGMPWFERLDWTPSAGGRLRMTGYWDGSVYTQARQLSQDPVYRTALENLWNRLAPATSAVTANFGAATYDWSILQDQHTDPVDAGDLEAAELSVHVAVAVDTHFGILGSGSDLYRVGQPLAQHLHYDPDALYTNPRDINMMTEEIEWLRPLAMGGGPPGHAWVVFGYNKGTDPNRQFKLNMGWAYDPANVGWYTLDQVPGGILLNHNQLTHLAPAGVVRFVGGGVAGDGSPADPYSGVSQAVGNAPNHTVLIFKAGSVNTFSGGSLVVNRPLIMKGYGATIRHQ